MQCQSICCSTADCIPGHDIESARHLPAYDHHRCVDITCCKTSLNAVRSSDCSLLYLQALCEHSELCRPQCIPPHELRQGEASLVVAAVDIDLDKRQPCRAAITQMQQEVNIRDLQDSTMTSCEIILMRQRGSEHAHLGEGVADSAESSMMPCC